MGPRGEDKQVMWLFLGAVAKNVGFCVCSLSSSETLCLTLFPECWTCQQSALYPPAPSLKGHSQLHPHPHSPPKNRGQWKRCWHPTFQSILVLQISLPWLLVGIQTGPKRLILCASLELTHWWTLLLDQLLACLTEKGRHFPGYTCELNHLY